MLYVGDYLADTTHLTTEQHGAYLLILFALWRRGGWLPNQERVLCKVTGLTLKKWRATSAPVMALLDVEGDQITQRRLLLELEKASVKSKQASGAGKASAEAKALKKQQQGSTDVAVPLQRNDNEKGGNQNQNQSHKEVSKSLVSAAPPPSKAKATKGSRWPKGQSVPDAWIELARKRLTDLERPVPDLRLEAEKFVSYWTAQSGQRGLKLDWGQTFYNWVLNAKIDRAYNNRNRPTGFDALAEGASRAIASFGQGDAVAGSDDLLRLAAMPDAA